MLAESVKREPSRDVIPSEKERHGHSSISS